MKNSNIKKLTHKEIKDLALKVSNFLKDQKCQDVVTLDLAGVSNWTDFFVIATVASKAHASGVLRHLNDFFKEEDMDMSISKKSSEDSWIFIDCPGIGIHIMNNESREFYNLEKLWSMAQKLD